MVLELHQNDRLIGPVVLKFYKIEETNKQGYSATVIPGLNHKYKLVNNKTKRNPKTKHRNIRKNRFNVNNDKHRPNEVSIIILESICK